MMTASGRLALVAALACTGAPAVAQLPAAAAAERATFALLVNGDTLAMEHSTRTPSSLVGDLYVRANGMRFVYQVELGDSAAVLAIDNAFFARGDTAARQRARIELRGDTAVVRVGDAVRPFRTRPGALPMINMSVALIEQVVLRALAMGGDSAEVAVFQVLGGMTTPATVQVRRGAAGAGLDSASFRIAGVEFLLALRADGRIASGAVPAQRVTLGRLEGHRPLESEAPDYSPPAGAPYTAEDVVITTPAGIRLTGTLTLPAGARGTRSPAIVTISGSGAQSRDGVSVGLAGYRPFRELADTLGRRGIAVLRLDDRGMGGSDLGPRTVTSADFADDVRAALAFLRSHSRVDGARLGLVGHSEGGIIAPMVAATDPALRAVVVMAGTARPGRQVLPHQQRYAVDSMARLTGAARDSALAASARATDSLAAALPWMRFFLEHDPAVPARRVRAAVLILHGEDDHQVPVSEAALLAAAVRAGGNRDVTVRTFARTNHLFVPHGETGFDYARLPSLAVRREVLGAAADWLARALR